MGFEGVEPSRLAAPVSKTGAYANSARSPICSLPTFTRRATKNPGRLRDNPGLFQLGYCLLQVQYLPGVAACHTFSSCHSFLEQSTQVIPTSKLVERSGRCDGDIANVPTPDRCAVEIESRCFNVCIRISSRLHGRQGDDSLPACGKRTQATFLLRRWSICGFWNYDPVDLRLAPGGVNRQVSQRDECRLRRSDRADG